MENDTSPLRIFYLLLSMNGSVSFHQTVRLFPFFALAARQLQAKPGIQELQPSIVKFLHLWLLLFREVEQLSGKRLGCGIRS